MIGGGSRSTLAGGGGGATQRRLSGKRPLTILLVRAARVRGFRRVHTGVACTQTVSLGTDECSHTVSRRDDRGSECNRRNVPRASQEHECSAGCDVRQART